MPITKDINVKANLRQKTDADLLSNLSQPVVAIYEADSVAAQTQIPNAGNLPFIVDIANRENVEVFVDGKFLSYGKDYEYAEITGNNTSSKISLMAPIAADLPINVIKRGLKKESEFGTDNRFTELYSLFSATFQGAVDGTAQLTAVNGTPGAGQFRTFDISNRASIPDLANDLNARMGIIRIPTHEPIEMPDEFGATGQRVFGLANDKNNQIRFVGNWVKGLNTNGYAVQSTDSTDYSEIVFYGTGLNILTYIDNTVRTLFVTVDGGSEGSVGFTTASHSNVLSGRNYVSNTVFPIVSGLSLGLHTVKIRYSTYTLVEGFEVLNESANVNVRPGTAYIGGKRLIANSASSVAYNSGFESVVREGVDVAFSSARGARVLEYIKSDATFGKAAYLTNATQGNLASADHTYEEVIKKISWREFGAGRSDDFSTLQGSTVDRAFTLDDGSTTLVGDNVWEGGSERLNHSSGSVTINFVGTGLDFIRSDTANSGATETITVTVDGTSLGALASNTGSTVRRREKIVSGLPYGTHTVRISATSASWNMGIIAFIVYGPKKPTLPAGAVELADYNIMADYVPNTVSGTLTIGTGALRKVNTREFTYAGTWSFAGLDMSVSSGWFIQGITNGGYMEYTFFGTGFDLRMNQPSATATATIALNGTLLTTANFPTATFSTYGAGMSYAPTTAILSVANAGGYGQGFVARNLPLAKYTIRVTLTNTAGWNFEALDIVTPIHSHVESTPSLLQGALPIGSCTIRDLRKFDIVKNDEDDQDTVIALARGINSAPSTTTQTFYPIPDMTTTIKSSGSWYMVHLEMMLRNSSVSDAWFAIFVDGTMQTVSDFHHTSANSNNPQFLSLRIPVYLPEGTHKVDGYWRTNASNTLSSDGVNRYLIVERVKK